MGYTFTQTKEELQKGADAALAIWQAVGIIVSDGAGNITVVPVDVAPAAGSSNLITSGAVSSALGDLADDVDTALADKQDLVPTATENNLVSFDAGGQVKDSGKKVADFLLLSGGTMTGVIAMGSHKITGLATPTEIADAATKKYVDDADANKQALVTTATENDISVFNAAGQIKDSGINLSDLLLTDKDDDNKKYVMSFYVEDGHFCMGLNEYEEES